MKTAGHEIRSFDIHALNKLISTYATKALEFPVVEVLLGEIIFLA